MKLRITALTAALMTALKLRLVWLGGAGPEWLATRVTAMSATPLTMAMAPFTATRRMATRSTSHIAPRVDTGCGITRGTVPAIGPLSDAISPLARVSDLCMPPVLVSGVIGSKKPTKVSSSLF